MKGGVAEPEGRAPTHWQRVRLRRVVSHIEQGWSPSCEAREVEGDEWGVLKVGCVNGYVFNEGEHKALPPELDPRPALRVHAGDVLMSRANTKELLGSAALVESINARLMLSDKTYRLHLKPGCEPRFFIYAMASSPVRYQFERDSSGASNSMQNISQESLREFGMLLPPLDEQRAIADFLDRKTAAIDAAIDKKTALLDRLAEQRASVINRAVTRGLDPAVELVASGLSWVGPIPRHWRLMRSKYLLDQQRPVMYGIVLPGPHVADGVPIVKAGNCRPGRLRLDKMKRTSPEIERKYVRSRLLPGDVVISIRGSTGEAAIVPPELAGANLTQDAARLAPGPRVRSGWLRYVTQSAWFDGYLTPRIAGATVKGINIWDLSRVPLPLVPLDEQAAIEATLDAAMSRLNAAADAIRRQIKKLGAYRQSIITAAVTGRLSPEAA